MIAKLDTWHVLKRVTLFIAALVFLYVLTSWITPYVSTFQRNSFDRQVAYIYAQLRNGEDQKLQAIYPEGYLFAHAIFALSLIEHADQEGVYSKMIAGMVEESIMKMDSDQCRSRFQRSQELPYGAFYNGWLNFTLKKYKESPLFAFSVKTALIDDLHEELTKAIVNSQSSLHILESYPGSSWPGDNLACIASLPDGNKELRNSWVDLLQETSGDYLIHHSNSDENEIRGSSQALTLYFLSHIETSKARSYEDEFRKRFVDSWLFVELVVEHEKSNYSDIDSGPVLFGYGSVATIMHAKAQRALGRPIPSTRGFLNTIGLPISIGGKKFYLFRNNLMFDIFMLWINV